MNENECDNAGAVGATVEYDKDDDDHIADALSLSTLHNVMSEYY